MTRSRWRLKFNDTLPAVLFCRARESTNFDILKLNLAQGLGE